MANVYAPRVCLIITRDVTVSTHARGISLPERILLSPWNFCVNLFSDVMVVALLCSCDSAGDLKKLIVKSCGFGF